MMTSNELRDKFLNFFESKGHKRLPSASLVPKDDSSVLFTSAGMQQFRRFYANPNEAPAAAITTCQKCIRTSDIEEVGDATHLTFFEMLGNFSFGYPGNPSAGGGSYFKKEAITYAWEFLTDVLKIEKNRLSATYFKGEDDITADDESLAILQEVTGLADDKIKGTGKDETFWSLGTEGSPGGPTVEFYIDGVEIWNLVFNQYTMQGGKYIPSKYQGVDTGMGLERLSAMMQGKNDVYETDLFEAVIKAIAEESGRPYNTELTQIDLKNTRIIADHIKAATFMISEGLIPSNKDRGYILRRIIRGAIVKGYRMGVFNNFCAKVADKIFEIYPEINNREYIIDQINKEEENFRRTLTAGLGEIDSYEKHFKENGMKVDGHELFLLFQSRGIPIEISVNELKTRNVAIEDNAPEKYQELYQEHQEKSRTASAGMFKGGLADAGEDTTKLHTTAHLMLAAMRAVLGDDVQQKGSNITAERLRFDFNYPEKLSDEQIKEIENIVNKNIKADLLVTMQELSIEDAKNSGATGVFDDRYGDKVKVYTIGSPENIVSREICGGPHVSRTGELGHFKITKEESSSAGVRRIKAVLE